MPELGTCEKCQIPHQYVEEVETEFGTELLCAYHAQLERELQAI